MARSTRYYSLALAFIALVFVSSITAAQVAGQRNPMQQASAPAAPIEANEIKLLQRQLEDSRRFQDQTLATVYWALSLLGTVAVLLVGFGWFVNFRVYERDKAALERDLRAQISEDTLAFSIKVNEATAANASKAEQLLSTQLAVIEDRINAKIKEQLELQERRIAGRLAAHTTELRDLASDVLTLQLERCLAKRRSWLQQDIPRNALQATVDALKIANKIGYEHTVAEVLDFVSKDIGAIISAKKTPIDNFLVAQLVAVLDAVKGDHAHAAATLKASTNTLLST